MVVAEWRAKAEHIQNEEVEKRRQVQAIEENMHELESEVRNLTEQYTQKETSYKECKEVVMDEITFS